MLRPRTYGKIILAILIIGALVIAIIYAAQADAGDWYKGFRAITSAIMALTFATIYRYVED